jgi:hypothetical protein
MGLFLFLLAWLMATVKVFGLSRNLLKGQVGNEINVLMAAYKNFF